MRKIFYAALIAALLLALLGCAPARAPMPTPMVVEKEVVVEREAPLELALPAPPGERLPELKAGAITERMIVSTVDISLVVKDAGESLEEIKAIAAEADGYVAGSNMWRDEEERLRGSVTIRVPAQSLDAVVEKLKEMAVEVEREGISGQDVTEEYTDLKSQLRNLEATEAQLLEIMEEARKTEDVLAVYRELTDIRGRIEQTKGRMQYLERMSALATINIELIPEEEDKPIVEPGWAPLRTLRNASRALVNTLKLFADAAIWIIFYALPILLILAIPFIILWLVWRWWRRRRRPAV